MRNRVRHFHRLLPEDGIQILDMSILESRHESLPLSSMLLAFCEEKTDTEDRSVEIARFLGLDKLIAFREQDFAKRFGCCGHYAGGVPGYSIVEKPGVGDGV
jgi:hypothetical protein